VLSWVPRRNNPVSYILNKKTWALKKRTSKRLQVKKLKDIVQLAEKIGGKYFGSSNQIKFDNFESIAYLLTDSNYADDEPKQAYFQGRRVNLTKARNIKHDLRGCSAYFCLATGQVFAKRAKEVREIYHYDVIIWREIVRRIRLHPELSSLLRIVREDSISYGWKYKDFFWSWKKALEKIVASEKICIR